jgi:hypothetical protein
LADAGQGIVAGERGKGAIGVEKFNPPQIEAGDRLADEPVKNDREKKGKFSSIR